MSFFVLPIYMPVKCLLNLVMVSDSTASPATCSIYKPHSVYKTFPTKILCLTLNLSHLIFHNGTMIKNDSVIYSVIAIYNLYASNKSFLSLLHSSKTNLVYPISCHNKSSLLQTTSS